MNTRKTFKPMDFMIELIMLVLMKLPFDCRRLFCYYLRVWSFWRLRWNSKIRVNYLIAFKSLYSLASFKTSYSVYLSTMSDVCCVKQKDGERKTKRTIDTQSYCSYCRPFFNDNRPLIRVCVFCVDNRSYVDLSMHFQIFEYELQSCIVYWYRLLSLLTVFVSYFYHFSGRILII